MNRAGSIGGHLGQALSSPCPVVGWIRRQKTSAFSKHDLMRSPALWRGLERERVGTPASSGIFHWGLQRFPAWFYKLFYLNCISSHLFILLFFFRYRYNRMSMAKPWSLLVRPASNALSFLHAPGCPLPARDRRTPMASSRFPPGTRGPLWDSCSAESKVLCSQPIPPSGVKQQHADPWLQTLPWPALEAA